MKKYLVILLLLLFSLASPQSAKTNIVTSQNIKVTIKNIEPFTYCSVQHQGSLGEMESSIQILIGNMSRQNIAPGGTLFVLFQSIPEEGKESTLDWEVGFPITAYVLPQPPLKKGQWDHTTVASATHTGSVDTLGGFVDEILEWMDNNDYTKDGPILCSFLNIDSEDTIPSRLMTEIWIVCKKK